MQKRIPISISRSRTKQITFFVCRLLQIDPQHTVWRLRTSWEHWAFHSVTCEGQSYLPWINKMKLKAGPHPARRGAARHFSYSTKQVEKRIWCGHNIRIYQCKPIALLHCERARCGPAMTEKKASAMAPTKFESCFLPAASFEFCLQFSPLCKDHTRDL